MHRMFGWPDILLSMQQAASEKCNNVFFAKKHLDQPDILQAGYLFGQISRYLVHP